MVYILRNNKGYGPYDINVLLTYVNNGQILLHDRAKMGQFGNVTTVSKILKQAGLTPKVAHGGNLFVQLRKIGTELILPKDSFKERQWLSDKRLMVLALIGLSPMLLMVIPINMPFLVFYAVSLYFSCIWGLFFFYFFKTSQVSIKTTILVFLLTQLFVFIAWDFLGIVALNPFYLFCESPFPINFVGYTLGVGLTEELAKLLPLIVIYKKAKEPLIPLTMVYYGLMSGIAFGVYEGVQYQMGVNAQLDYTGAFFMNIARLTSLPFLHAIWCGIAGYFMSFAKLYPKYRVSLYFLAIFIPSILHGIYDVFCGVYIIVSVLIALVTVLLLVTYIKRSANYQSKLRNNNG